MDFFEEFVRVQKVINNFKNQEYYKKHPGKKRESNKRYMEKRKRQLAVQMDQ